MATRSTSPSSIGRSPATGTSTLGSNNATAPQPGGVQHEALTQERIAMRAYDKWCQGGCQEGCSEQNWLDAEQELRSEQSRKSR